MVLKPKTEPAYLPTTGGDIDLVPLKGHLAANDMAAIDTFAAMRDALISHGGAAAVGAIAEAIECLDFRGALKYLIEEFENDR